MLPQEIALEKICQSLQEDEHVVAIFVKGSMGRNEYDEHSDIDLYCMVDKQNEQEFLARRLEHIKAYRPIIFQDDIFIIAPQIIAVYDDYLHIDLFTVTRETFSSKDYFKVLYDPHQLLDEFVDKQSLVLSDNEFKDNVIDVAWFMFQYKKSSARGNDIWSVKMLTNAMEHLARVLLHRYSPERAQLGLKTIERSLPANIINELSVIFKNITPENNRKAANLLSEFLLSEAKWIRSHFNEGDQVMLLLDKMIEFHLFQRR
ncbi:nucleotidyltransferase domain-containing protein [Virgibacillus flavescens]|uniref:nucleotidyltransferase domain-containing protein n=1 Tax=Virgibacillus flavescens TaxID=1611422 RepID=UPI003D340354